eukprot:scaffold10944_cov110-Isochrysis_galbana.AAC.6
MASEAGTVDASETLRPTKAAGAAPRVVTGVAACRLAGSAVGLTGGSAALGSAFNGTSAVPIGGGRGLAAGGVTCDGAGLALVLTSSSAAGLTFGVTAGRAAGVAAGSATIRCASAGATPTALATGRGCVAGAAGGTAAGAPPGCLWGMVAEMVAGLPTEARAEDPIGMSTGGLALRAVGLDFFTAGLFTAGFARCAPSTEGPLNDRCATGFFAAGDTAGCPFAP